MLWWHILDEYKTLIDNDIPVAEELLQTENFQNAYVNAMKVITNSDDQTNGWNKYIEKTFTSVEMESMLNVF